MKRTVAFLIATASLAVTAEPLSIKGMSLGDDAAAITERFKAGMCKAEDCFFTPIRAGSGTDELATFAGAKVEYVTAYFDAGKLAMVRVKLNSQHAPTISSALTEKYGTPIRTEDEFKSKGGYVGKKVTLTWAQGDTELLVESPAGSLNDMIVALRSKAFLEKKVNAAKTKAKSDL